MNRRKAIMALPFLAALPWLSKSGDGDERRVDATDRKKKVNEALSRYAETKRMGMATKRRVALHVSADESIIESARVRIEERSKGDPTYTLEEAERDASDAFERFKKTVRVEVA